MASTGERPLSFSRALSLVLALATIAAAAVVFDEKRDSARVAAEVSRLQAEIREERERISELKAEWSLLDQPARLQALVEAHPEVFPIGPMLPTQIAGIEDVPWRPIAGPPTADGTAPSLAPRAGAGAGAASPRLAAETPTVADDEIVDESSSITESAEEH